MLPLGLLLAALVTFFQFASDRITASWAPTRMSGTFRNRLIVRDYLVSGFHESPMRFADEYYRHYPKIGLGLASALLHRQAFWTLIFPVGPGRCSGWWRRWRWPWGW